MLSLNARRVAQDPGPAEAPACQGAGIDPDLFFPEASHAAGPPSLAERRALLVCAGCPVRDWCLAREMAECTVETRINGVRGGLRQADRRALFVELRKRKRGQQ
ncbi:WhiB family transcriptional regulator [Streptomyces sp. NPDC089919]|uniref:WhiB family transcriptional regulator n=1 Tax=Streptomyces sp. NPDC089919 TaxID=3155188 RepID=UPI0034134AE7